MFAKNFRLASLKSYLKYFKYSKKDPLKNSNFTLSLKAISRNPLCKFSKKIHHFEIFGIFRNSWTYRTFTNISMYILNIYSIYVQNILNINSIYEYNIPFNKNFKKILCGDFLQIDDYGTSERNGEIKRVFARLCRLQTP